jgi:hypothetical protein
MSRKPSQLCLVASHTWDTLGAVAAGCEAALIKRVGNDVLGVGPQPQIVGNEPQRRRRPAHRPMRGTGLIRHKFEIRNLRIALLPPELSRWMGSLQAGATEPLGLWR